MRPKRAAAEGGRPTLPTGCYASVMRGGVIRP